MKRIFIVGASSGTNVGDNLFFECILRDFENEEPEVMFTIPARNPDWFAKYLSQYSIEIIPIRNIDLLLKLPLILVRAVKAMYSSDLILITAGMYYDWSLFNPRQNTLFAFLIFVAIAKMLRRPIGAYCAGVGPICTRLGKYLIRFIFNALTFIILRDKTSESLLQTIGVTKPPIFVTIDPVVNVIPTDEETTSHILVSNGIPRSNVKVGVNINYLMDAMAKPDSRWNESEFIEVIASAADSIVEDFQAVIIFIVMCSDDIDMTEKIQCKMTHKKGSTLLRLYTGYTSSEIAGIISKLDAMIGMRLHSVVIATAMGVPTIAVSYAPKVQSYMEMLEQGKHVLQLNELSSEKLLGKFQELWLSRDSIREALVSKIAELKLLNNSVKIAINYSRNRKK